MNPSLHPGRDARPAPAPGEVRAAWRRGVEDAARQACYLCDVGVPRQAAAGGDHFHRTWRFGRRRACKASAVWSHVQRHPSPPPGIAGEVREARRAGFRLGKGLVCDGCREDRAPVVHELVDGHVRPVHAAGDGAALACAAHWRALVDGPGELRELMQLGR